MTGREIRCPYCGRINDQHSWTEGIATPSDGDVALCWGCHQPAVYTVVAGELAQRQATEAERAEILADPRVRRALAALGPARTPQEALRGLRGDLS